MKLEIARLFFETNETICFSESHLLRGCISKVFSKEEKIHNHDLKSGKSKYNYPEIQFKIIFGKAVIIAIGQHAIDIMYRVFSRMEYLQLGVRKLPIQKRIMEVNSEHLGIDDTWHHYSIATPLIILNSKNYQQYKQDVDQRQQLLTQCLIGNLLSFSKSLNYHVPEAIHMQHRLNQEPQNVTLKGEKMLAFSGEFSTNFLLPDLLGIGKSPSRGYGCCMHIKERMIV